MILRNHAGGRPYFAGVFLLSSIQQNKVFFDIAKNDNYGIICLF